MLRIVPDLCRGVCGALRLHNPYERQPMRIRLQQPERGGRRPYPYFVAKDGTVEQRKVFKNDRTTVVGFQESPNHYVIAVTWAQAWADPSVVAGMFLVTADSGGNFSTHTDVIESATVVED